MKNVGDRFVVSSRDKARAIAVLASEEDPVERWRISNGVYNTVTSYVRLFVYYQLDVNEDETC